MKTKEFIKQVEVMGYEVFCERSHTRVFTEDDAYSTYLLASIGEEYERAINTFTECGGHGKVFDLVIEYARTPIEERKEQPLYGVFLKSDDSVLTRFYHNYMDLDGHSYESEIVALPTPNRQLAEAIALIECGGVYKVTE